MDILGNQVRPMVQMLFPNREAILQASTARNVQSWFEEHEDAIQHLPWREQSPELNTIKPRSVSEGKVRSRFPPPRPLQQLDGVHEEWYNIPLETIQNFYVSIPRKIQAVLQANGGPAP